MKGTFIIIILVFLTGCDTASSEADAKSFFDKHKIGSSPDFGLFADHHELVAAVFGFGDDLKACLQFADAMNKDDPGRFSCQPLNH